MHSIVPSDLVAEISIIFTSVSQLFFRLLAGLVQFVKKGQILHQIAKFQPTILLLLTLCACNWNKINIGKWTPLQILSWIYQTPSITFDANFESGNLASAERTNEFEYDLFIQPDVNTSTRMWFYFRCQKVPIGRPVLFHVVGINKQNTTFSSMQRVLVRSTSRTKWQRLPSPQQFYTNSTKHRCYTNYPVLSFVFQFDREEEYFFSFGYPYTYSMLSKFIGRIKDHGLSFVQIDTLGGSKMDRDLTVLKIGVPSPRPSYKSGSPLVQTHHVIILARQHPGEFPGSYVCHGILEYLLSNNPKAKFLRNNVVFNIVPMANPDGVFAGHYRANASGLDLNRNFYDTDPQTAPECAAVKQLFDQLMGPERSDYGQSFEKGELHNILLQLAQEHNIGSDTNFLNENDHKQETPSRNSSRSTSRISSVSRDVISKGMQKFPSVPTLPPAKQGISQQQIPLPTGRQGGVIKSVTQGAQVVQAPTAPGVPIPGRISYQDALSEELKASQTVELHKTRIDFIVDLHSHSNYSGGFLFLNPDAHVFHRLKRQRTELVFPQLLAHKCAAFGSLQSSFKESQNLRPGSLRRAFCQYGKQRIADDCPYIYGLEVSNAQGPDPNDEGKTMLKVEDDAESSDQDDGDDTGGAVMDFVPYTPKMYMKIGEKICDTFYEIYSRIFK